MRAFVAINFPEYIKEEIKGVQDSLKPHVKSARWTRPGNFHLTLKFLGEIDRIQKESACAAIKQVCADMLPFEIEFDGLGYFGTQGDMKVVWIGLNGGIEEIMFLHNNIEKTFKDSGFPSDKKGFKPHITIARDVRILSSLDGPSFRLNLSKIVVSEISLMLSENKGAGFYYTPLYTCRF
ncbi:RNA 2',3'-cyclic phosphodiesterase [Calorimonas adulescens]|uniref:RNA 2',3'-cyclic phosphodiesterase n=1 Tax=Calorimonas adulescens TaxID=2606906 RepID=UPI001396AD77|nr:RNA 2',3'-cyclic phosphodiesterase [Calorimonas adulescens]